MDIIDLTDDFEEETRFSREQDRYRREADCESTASGSESDSLSSPVLVLPAIAGRKNTTANTNSKRPAKKKQKQKKDTNRFQGWRAHQNFDEPLEEVPLTEKAKEKKAKEAEQKEIGNRIQELAASVGWSQPRRKDSQRTTKKNAAAVPYRYKQERTAACIICGDKVPLFEITKLKCKHHWCNPCMQQNFQVVIADTNSWPARCCKPLEPELASMVLSAEEFAKYLDIKKAKEHMSSTRCYLCEASIPSANLIGGSTAFCSLCENVTCVHCTKAMHEGACMLDPETEKLMQMAKGKKWSKCPSCSNMVERNTGCNSMSCRCGMNFCYKCGRPMSQCTTLRGCNQIDFQPTMWQAQTAHKPIYVNSSVIAGYRQRSKEGEEALLIARGAMQQQNSEALEKQKKMTEIMELRAKLEKKPAKGGSESPTTGRKPSISSTTTPVKTPKTPQTPIGLEGYRKAFPALMKALGDDQSAKEKEAPKKLIIDTPDESPVEAVKRPPLLESYAISFPALMKYFDSPKPNTSEITVAEPSKQMNVSVPQPDILDLSDIQDTSFSSLWDNFDGTVFDPFETVDLNTFTDFEDGGNFSIF